MNNNEWKEYKIKDIAEKVFSGGTPSTKIPDFWNGDYNWLSSGETRNKFITNTEKKISKSAIEKSSTRLAEKNDIVIASAGQGNTRGQTSICKIDTYINQSIIAIKGNLKVINPYFLFYNISGRYNELRQISDGHSIRGSLTTKIINEFKLNLPPLKEQKAIANILSSLDEKIEVNNKINKNLEDMAQAIFKHWFVDFEFPNEEGKPYKSSGGKMVESEMGMIPEGWEVKNIGDLCEISSSKRIFMKEYSNEGIPFFRSKEIIEKSKGSNISTELFITEKRYLDIKDKFGVPKENDILLTSVGTLGTVYLVDNERFYFKDGNLTWFKNFNYKYYSQYIYNYLKSSEGKNVLDSISIGSTQKALTIGSLRQLKILIPLNNILDDFAELAIAITKNIRKNIKENENVINIRDTLLPKLMSGKVRVPLDYE